METYTVTGGAGFIGSHLVDLLLKKGHKVIAIDNLSTGNIFNLNDALKNPNFKFVHTDFAKSNIDHLFKKGDRIFHLAATVGVDKVCENPQATFDNNHSGLIKLLKIAKSKGCEILYTSTSEVYGTSTTAMQENDESKLNVLHGGRCAYTLSKLLGEFMCLTYCENHNVPVRIVRLFNTIGPRQNSQFGMVVPRFIQQALDNQPITVFGDGSHTRSFCYVDDTVAALYKILQHPDTVGQIYNIGNDEAVTISSLAKEIKAINKSKSQIMNVALPKSRDNSKEISHRKPTLNKIKKMTGWSPKHHWREAVLLTNQYFSDLRKLKK